MNINLKKKLAFFFPIQIILVKIISFFPEHVERYYSNGIYQYISNFSRILLGWIPFSVGDILYFVLGIFIIYWFFKIRKGFFRNWKENGISILAFISVIYFCFQILWALNYNRVSLDKKLQISTEYTEEDLKELTLQLIDLTNKTHVEITKDSSKKVDFTESNDQIFAQAQMAYSHLPQQLSFITYNHLSLKNSIYSKPLSFGGWGGYLNPFTNEAQVNRIKPKLFFYVTTYHEMAHQTGIGSESGCNFIGFMVAKHNPNSFSKFSAYSFALTYCLSSIKELDEKLYGKLKEKINKGIILNMEESDRFWKDHQSYLENITKFFYDNFLKFNLQNDGMKGYSKFIDLLINYNKKHKNL